MYLSASQLFDLVKAKKRATQTGKRGGRFYVSTAGKRVYTGEDPAVESKHVAQTPHTSSKTQGPVDVTLLPSGPEDPAMQGKMSIRPEKHYVNMPARRAAIQQQQQNWPSYFCRSCKAAIVPKHNVPIREGSPHHQVPEPSKVDAKGEPIRRRVGTTTKVLVVGPSGRRSTHYGWNPEYLSSRQCPDCFDAEAKAARKESKEASETKRDVDLFLTHTQQMASQKKQSEKETRRLARLAKEGEKRRARVEQSSQRVRDEREKQKAKAKRAHVIREDKPAVPSISFRDRVRGRFKTEYGTARTGVVVNTQLREGQMYYQIEPDVKTPEDKPKPRVWAPKGSLKKIEKSVTLWVSL